MKRVFVVMLAAISILSGCTKDEPKTMLKGPEVKVHGGAAWTWVQVDHNKNPLRMAVSLNDKALNSVPVGNQDGGHEEGYHYTLKFHPQAPVSPFNHVGMGWNPSGHEPEQIYGVPHFDFHFYMPTPETIQAIPAYDAAPGKFDNWPETAYFPANYLNVGGGVPQMGAHWVDVTSPELNGNPFTQTFIYGSYDGEVTFYEPMITLEFLKNTSNFVRAIPQPEKVQKSGYYPTKLKVEKHNGVTNVILDEMVYRQAN
jgi:hypothetical protein